jgi:hypothetical protein
MKLIIAPSASGKSHFIKGLIRLGRRFENPGNERKTWLLQDTEKVVVHDADHIPEIEGVYKALNKEFGKFWWNRPESDSRKEALMGRAWGNVHARLSENEIVLTAECKPLVMYPTMPAVFVVPCFDTLLAHSAKRIVDGNDSQPYYGTLQEAIAVEAHYIRLAHSFGRPYFPTFDDGVTFLMNVGADDFKDVVLTKEGKSE